MDVRIRSLKSLFVVPRRDYVSHAPVARRRRAGPRAEGTSGRLRWGAGKGGGIDAEGRSHGSIESRDRLLAIARDCRTRLRRRGMQRSHCADGAGCFVMLVFVLRTLLLRMRAHPPLIARFEQRGERDRALQRKKCRERELVAPPGQAAEGAGSAKHGILRLRRGPGKR